MPRPPPLSTVHVLTVQLYRHPVSVRPSGLSLGCPRWLAEASPVRLSIVSLDTHTLWHARPATIPYRPGPGPPFRSSCGLTRHDTCGASLTSFIYSRASGDEIARNSLTFRSCCVRENSMRRVDWARSAVASVPTHPTLTPPAFHPSGMYVSEQRCKSIRVRCTFVRVTRTENFEFFLDYVRFTVLAVHLILQTNARKRTETHINEHHPQPADELQTNAHKCTQTRLNSTYANSTTLYSAVYTSSGVVFESW